MKQCDSSWREFDDEEGLIMFGEKQRSLDAWGLLLMLQVLTGEDLVGCLLGHLLFCRHMGFQSRSQDEVSRLH